MHCLMDSEWPPTNSEWSSRKNDNIPGPRWWWDSEWLSSRLFRSDIHKCPITLNAVITLLWNDLMVYKEASASEPSSHGPGMTSSSGHIFTSFFLFFQFLITRTIGNVKCITSEVFSNETIFQEFVMSTLVPLYP